VTSSTRPSVWTSSVSFASAPPEIRSCAATPPTSTFEPKRSTETASGLLVPFAAVELGRTQS
jgi:hypothetical protein